MNLKRDYCIHRYADSVVSVGAPACLIVSFSFLQAGPLHWTQVIGANVCRHAMRNGEHWLEPEWSHHSHSIAAHLTNCINTTYCTHQLKLHYRIEPGVDFQKRLCCVSVVCVVQLGWRGTLD